MSEAKEADTIGRRLKRLRGQLTQEALARQVGLVAMTISRIERGVQTPDSDTVTKLSNFFHVSPAYILFGVEPTESRIVYDRDIDVDYAAEQAQLNDEQRHKLYTACRSIGPMSRAELMLMAERLVRNARTEHLKFPKHSDRAQSDPGLTDEEIEARGLRRYVPPKRRQY